MKPFLRTAYNYDMNLAGDESALHCTDKTLAQQSFKDECDINNILKQFGVTGELPTGIRQPTYGDFTGLNDFQEAMNAVRSATESFNAMPADIRTRFDNDPGKFVDFCSDPANAKEIDAMGLLSPEAHDKFMLEGETAEELRKANQRAADELRGLKAKKGDNNQNQG